MPFLTSCNCLPCQALKASAAKGERASPEWGAGASASGHAHVVAGWATMSAEARGTLVEDLLQARAYPISISTSTPSPLF